MSALLLSLPEELVAATSDHVHVADLLNFALACKETHRIAKDRLIIHKAWHEWYKIQHDRLPLTVPRQLREPQAAWHTRALDFWGMRPGWQQWKTYDLQWGEDEDPNWPEPVEDHSHLADDGFFSEQELDAFDRILSHDLHLPWEEYTTWSTMIRQGYDEPLKGILMALSPKLDRVNFIAYDPAAFENAHPMTDFQGIHPLKFFCLAIKSIAQTPSAVWPPGFRSLRKVSVCTGTTLRHPHAAYYANAQEITPLFLLPNLKVLNLTLLGYIDEDEPEWELPERESSVEELAFSCCNLDFEKYAKLIRACKHLKRFLGDMPGASGVRVLELLAAEFAGTLEELLVVLFGNEHFDASIFKRFTNLRTLGGLDVALVISRQPKPQAEPAPRELLGCAMAPPDSKDQIVLEQRSDGSRESSESRAIEFRTLQHFLPASVQTVRLRPSGGLRDIPGMHKSLVQAIADIAEDDSYPNFKQVCIWDFLPSSDPWPSRDTSFQWDQDAYQRILAQGVDVHRYGAHGQPMTYEEHVKLHHDFSSGRLTEIETDPRPPEERD